MRKTNEKKLILTETGKKNTLKNSIVQYGTMLQRVVKHFPTNVPKLTTNDLGTLVNAPESLLRAKVRELMPVTEVAGFKVKADEQINALELPDITRLKELCTDMLKLEKRAGQLELYRFFTLQDGKVNLEAEMLENYLNNLFDVYTNTGKENEVFEASQKVLKAVNELDGIMMKYGSTYSPVKKIYHIGIFIEVDGVYYVSPSFIQNHS